MATSKTVSPSKGLRTLAELRSLIPIGGSCWVIVSNPHTKEPKGVEQFIRKSASVFESELSDDEEHMHESLLIEHILKRPYGGAWLKKRDATKYLTLLQKFWKDAPRTIDALAQQYEQKTLH